MLEVQRLAMSAVQAALAGRNLNQALTELRREHPELSQGERAAIQDLSFGELRHHGQLQGLLDALLAKPLSDPTLSTLLLIALYQLLHTRAKPYAVVDHAVRLAGRLGKPAAKGLVNAVLRNFLRHRDALLVGLQADEATRLSYPRWWIAEVKAQYPERWEALLLAGNRHPPMTLRVNLRRTTVAEYLVRLEQAELPARPLGNEALLLERAVPVDRLPGFAEGQVSVQDAAAQLAAHLLDVADGMRVLDACSAPGGKTGHLLELAELDLTALDRDGERLARVADNLARLGLAARLVCADAADPAAWWDGKPFARILLDAPCSGSGVVRRHPDIKWARRSSDLVGFAAQQDALLDALWPRLELGGKLLYATCSVFRQENQDRVAAFLSRHPDARMLPLPRAEITNGQVLPDELHDGFFYALLQKA